MATATSYTKAGVDAKAAPLATTAPLPPSETPTAGTSGAAARADHVHPVEPSAFGATHAGATAAHLYPIGGIFSSGDTSTAYKAQGTPLPIHRVTTLGRITSRGRAVDATTPGTVEVACYAVNAQGLPTGAPLFVTPAKAAETNVMAFTVSPAVTLQPGLYFLFAGPRAFGTVKPSLAAPFSSAYAQSFVPSNADKPEQYQPAISLANFDPGTPGWPTLTGTIADLEFVTTNSASIWGYAIRSA